MRGRHVYSTSIKIKILRNKEYRGEPDYIRSNNGPEFTTKKIKKWLDELAS